MKRAFLFVLKFRMYTLPLPKPCLSSPSDKIYPHSQKAHTTMNHGSQLYWVHCYLKGHTTSTIYAKWLPFIKGSITRSALTLTQRIQCVNHELENGVPHGAVMQRC